MNNTILLITMLLVAHTPVKAERLPAESSAKIRDQQEEKSKEKKKTDETKKEEIVPIRIISTAEKKKICDKYKGKIIAFYNETWMVEKNCMRRHLETEELYNLSLQKNRIYNVEGLVLSALEESETPNTPKRNCKVLDKKYITFSGSGVLYVKDCKKYSFQDWESYKDHSKKTKNLLVHALTKEEFEAIPDGGELASSLDHEYAQYLKEDSIDIIAVNKACLGLIGSFVTYLNKIYYIESVKRGKEALCVKREVEDTVAFFHKNSHMRMNSLKELSSTQAISIPNGKPYK